MDYKLNSYDYDVALSFAGEDRDYVKKVADLLRKSGVRVFYDEFEEANLWGKNLYEYLHDIYKNKAKYAIIFISVHYANKLWTSHERRAAQERALRESQEYILPARFDKNELPGLFSTISYIDLSSKTPDQFTYIILEKVNNNKRWWGKWDRESVILSKKGLLDIFDSDGRRFLFKIDIIDGARTGNISGTANIISDNEAVYESEAQIFAGKKNKCILKFLKLNDRIQIEGNNDCLTFCGMGAHFDGEHKLRKDIFYNIIPLSNILLSKLYKALGSEKYWEGFLKCLGGIAVPTPENEDNFQADIVFSFVKGFHSDYQTILMFSETEKTIYGAFLNLNKIYYFSSDDEYKNKMPKTIEKWKSHLSKTEIGVNFL